MLEPTDTITLDDLEQNLRTYVKQVNETKNPILVTSEGKTILVILDPDTYDALRNAWEESKARETIYVGQEAAKAG